MSTRPSMPSWLFASCTPSLARALNERSFRPPTSDTRPTLSFLPLAAAGVDDAHDEPLAQLLRELPQAATPKAELDVGHVSSTVLGRASSATRAGSSIARTPWLMRVTPGSSIAPRTEAGPAHSPAWTVQPRPAAAAIA